ncbi:DUF4304 domain-containing protein [Pseudomonas sp. 2FE]|uniref:DUF4304 domain-containing protein n=1 Tax=Pseudomonas sp. 2FE TaxID=2502190 RepID=UPI001484EECB|nr:DUF4304 domain-containing protein [Pseudomonas sp. 2FE]
MDTEEFIKAVSPLLKERGFKKANATWRKDQGESVAVFNVQKSQWGGGNYYINIGTYFHAFGNESTPTENKCHVRVRLSVEDPSIVISAAIEWFQARALLQDAAKLAESDSKKGLVFKELLSVVAT